MQDTTLDLTQLSQAIDLSSHFDDTKTDYDVDSIRVQSRFTEDIPDSISFFDSDESEFYTFYPIDSAWGQLYKRFGMPGKHYHYMRANKPGLHSMVANSFIEEEGARRSWFVRTINDETARALLSPRYTVYDNTQFLNLAYNVLSETGISGGELIRPHISPDECYVKIVIPELKEFHRDRYGKPYHAGIVLSNSEIGRKSLTISIFIQRTSCENSTVLPDEWSFTIHHLGDMREMSDKIEIAIRSLVGRVDQALERIQVARSIPVADLKKTILGMGEHYGWGEETIKLVLNGTENDDFERIPSGNLLDVVNGITYAGHNGNFSQELQERFETFGGSVFLMNERKVNSFAQYAPLEVA